PNGAGKSTLLKTIGGLERPSAGTVTLAGERVDGLAPHRVRQRGIAMVMQTPLTFGSMTVLENVALGAMFGGDLHQQRFLEMAKALAGRPRLLLVDEVMAGLNDAELAASVQIVRTARDTLGITIIWVEHVMQAVMRLAERVIVLNFGRMLAEGEPEAVMRHPEVIDAYLGEGRDA
ncbi:MAG: transporter ATP-binding protein, partial [Geminicoccaceae bacterium]|nr:transporter ATP-binding protein [Geminicoccaceae bacterium]